jgi:multidrug resistance efflux pump
MMGTILVLGYAALCVIVFKILRMPVNRWTVTTAAVSGVVVVGGLLLGMDYNHPLATDGRLYFYTTPITPTVQGIVIEVAVRPNVPLKKGDVLFRLDPRPYQAVVDQKKALLAEAEQNVKLLNASYDQALAAVAKARPGLNSNLPSRPTTGNSSYSRKRSSRKQRLTRHCVTLNRRGKCSLERKLPRNGRGSPMHRK